MRPLKPARFRKVGLFLLFWTALGLFEFLQTSGQIAANHTRVPWQPLLVTWLGGMYLAALTVPPVLWLGGHFQLERRPSLRRVALHLAACVVWSAGELFLAAAILPRIGPTFIPANLSLGLRYLLWNSLSSNCLLYWEILAVQAAFRYHRRYQDRERRTAELEAQLARAQLSTLKMQLQPHFLFNTLNAIMVLVRQQKAPQAEEVLGRFSDLLRSLLDDENAQEVPLRRELEYLRLYLSIEEVRFQDRLSVSIAVDPAVLDAMIPHMSLQPIVENALRHGLGRRSAAGKIGIIAKRSGGMLEIRIEDDGPGFPAASTDAPRGIGLSNTRARLRQLYGDRGSLLTGNAATGGAVVTIMLPYRPRPEIQETEARVQYFTKEMVTALSKHDFEKARLYSNEDRKARRDLALIRDKYASDPGETNS